MPSKQQFPLSTQIAMRSLIFSHTSLNEQEKNLLQTLREKYFGVEKVSRVCLRDNNENTIDAIVIDLQSVDFAKRLLNDDYILFGDQQYSIQSSTRSLIVLQVPSNQKCEKLLQDLGHNYLGIEKIFRFHDRDGKPVDIVRLDFKSESFVTTILNDKYILIDGARRPVQPYWSLIYHSTQKGKSSASKVAQNVSNTEPQNHLTEQRVNELIHTQQMELQAMINNFENKWNTHLLSLKTSSKNIDVDQLLSIFKDLKTVCQQFNQQNTQIQIRLGSMANRVQNITMQSQYDNAWPILSLQNGH
ncbi:unnamed protein product [Rotaria sp. Silwood2]|nr:unnamed protein product [Rotaria sp. Silwood2]CAF2530310.1 unnamed protein product [Rotaria sp. Silwood2]CAF2942412.1 unnamed protein product [Rotaria sp. Silwood2]CAF3934411.1 unnamed protein product [Rotaria sp. Silwood2]